MSPPALVDLLRHRYPYLSSRDPQTMYFPTDKDTDGCHFWPHTPILFRLEGDKSPFRVWTAIQQKPLRPLPKRLRLATVPVRRADFSPTSLPEDHNSLIARTQHTRH